MSYRRILFQYLLILPLALIGSPPVASAQSPTDRPARDAATNRPVRVRHGDTPVRDAAADSLARDNSAFALDLYHQLAATDGNVFFSPYSISTALAMTYAGARGNTEKEMAATLRFSLDQKKVHPAFAAVDAQLKRVQRTGNIRLAVANSLWPQVGHPFLDDYLSLLKEQYGVSIKAVDYTKASEDARKLINNWVEDKTEDKIKDLVQPGVLGADTRLVLVNAIYFKGKWQSQFKAANTVNLPFHVSTRESVDARMMLQTHTFRYASLPSLEILELPYAGDELSMTVLLPRATDGARELAGNLSADTINGWLGELAEREVSVILPRFKMTSSFSLNGTLSSMGMVDAFDSAKADFTGMDGRSDWLFIGAVLHKAFVEVNEEGTEAAAATAVALEALGFEAQPPVAFRADHPFVFLIRERQTGSILFLGRVSDPTREG